MKLGCALPLLALFVAFGLPPARAAVSAPDRLNVRGKNYVRLADWARDNDLQWRWIDREKTLQAGNNSTKLGFVVDSCEARINGVQVSLLFPVAYRDGTVYLSQLDASTTIKPLLSPAKNLPGNKIKTICLDPGHGGRDPGNMVGSRQEKEYTLLLAFELRDQLSKAGFKVSLTRTTDAKVDLPARPDLARRRGADLFVSLHFNATEIGRNEVKGAETYCLTPAGAPSTNAGGEGAGGWLTGNRYNEKNLLLAYQVQKALAGKLSVEDRGVKWARWAVLRDAAMPAVLIEAGFMSHPVESKNIFDPAYRRTMAQAILEGILAYKRIVER